MMKRAKSGCLANHKNCFDNVRCKLKITERPLNRTGSGFPIKEFGASRLGPKVERVDPFGNSGGLEGKLAGVHSKRLSVSCTISNHVVCHVP